MIRWEYATINIAVEGIFMSPKLNEEKVAETLNTMGKDGWELVSAFAPTDSRRCLFVFKRPADA